MPSTDGRSHATLPIEPGEPHAGDDGAAGLFGDALAHSVGWAASLVLAFLLVPLLVHRLSASDYGIWLTSLAATAGLGTLSLGIWWTVNRELSAHADQVAPPRALIADAYSTALLLGLAGGFLLCLAGDRGFWLGPTVTEGQRVTLMLAGPAFLFDQITACASAILAGRRQFGRLNGTGVAMNVVRAGGIAVLLVRGNGLTSVALWSVLTAAVGTCAFVLAGGGGAKWQRELRVVPPLSVLRRQARFTAQLQATFLLGSGMAQVVPLLVARVLGSGAVVPLYVGMRIPQVLATFAHRLGEAGYPLMVRIDRIRPGVFPRLAATATRCLVLVLLPASFVLWIGAPVLLRLWLGSFAPETLVIFRLVTLAFMLEAVTVPIDIALTAGGRSGTMLAVAVAATAAHLLVLVIFLPRVGVTATAVALFVATVVQTAGYGVAIWRTKSPGTH